MKISYLIISVIILTQLSACGFKLRGSQDLSAVLPEVRLVGTAYQGELGRELKRALSGANVVISDAASHVFQVTNESVNKRVLSVDSSGRANQYELTYQLVFRVFEVTAEKGLTREVLPEQHVELKKEYLFNQSQLLAKADEETRLVKSMREDAMVNLLRRLKYLLRQQEKQ